MANIFLESSIHIAEVGVLPGIDGAKYSMILPNVLECFVSADVFLFLPKRIGSIHRFSRGTKKRTR